MINILCQIWIIIFGCAAIWFIGRLESWKKWGYIFGLISQPAWFYTTIKYEQWGIFILSIFYTYSWGQGVYNYWIKEEDKDTFKTLWDIMKWPMLIGTTGALIGLWLVVYT